MRGRSGRKPKIGGRSIIQIGALWLRRKDRNALYGTHRREFVGVDALNGVECTVAVSSTVCGAVSAVSAVSAVC